MSPSRLLAPVVPLLVAAFLAATLVPVADASGADEPVLGSPGHLAPEARGWGKAHPRHVFNGGDPSGEVAKLEWRHWGAATAKGRGVTWLLRPEGGYYARPGRIVLRAEGLGTCRTARRRTPGWSSAWRTDPVARSASTGTSGRATATSADVSRRGWEATMLPRTRFSSVRSCPRVDLQELSDRAEITDALIRYTRAIDTGDWDRLDTVFTPDAQIDYTESGGIAAAFPEVKPWLAEMLPAFFPKRMHTLGQVEIRLDGDSAEVSAYFHNPMPMDDGRGGSKLVEFGGIYHHTMTRTPDGWRSRQLREEVVWKQNI